MELSDINLLNKDRFIEGVPHEWFTYLRKNAPIYFHPEGDGGKGFWVFSKYDDVVAIGRDAKRFSSDQATRRRGRHIEDMLDAARLAGRTAS